MRNDPVLSLQGRLGRFMLRDIVIECGTHIQLRAPFSIWGIEQAIVRGSSVVIDKLEDNLCT
jgi:hypothetical protein